MEIQWEKESTYALKAVTESGEILKKNKSNIGETSQKESDRDLVTEYDLLVEKNIKEILKASEFSILSEEAIPEEFDNTKNTFWAVDPIDGTVNFVYGIPISCISIGLIHNKTFQIGAVCAPFSNDLYFTYGNSTSYWNGKKLIYSNNAEVSSSLFIATFSGKSDQPDRSNEYQLFGNINDQSRGVLRMGSAALAICYAASNRVDCAYGKNAKLWDVAGALAIARLAGAEINITNFENNKLDFIVGNKNHIKFISSLSAELNL